MRLFALALTLFVPVVAFAAPHNFDELVDLVLTYINAGIGVALIAGIVIYFYGVSTSLHKTMQGDSSDMRTQILWGIIALFVMFSVWGILALLRNTLFGGSGMNFGSGDTSEDCATFDDCVIGDDGDPDN